VCEKERAKRRKRGEEEGGERARAKAKAKDRKSERERQGKRDKEKKSQREDHKAALAMQGYLADKNSPLPPRTTQGPQVKAYCRVLGGGSFL
jgi:hypothetical protein